MPIIYTQAEVLQLQFLLCLRSDNITALKMAGLLTTVVMFAVFTLVTASPAPAQSPGSYTECSTSADCGQGKCCVLVNGRYATTTCMRRPLTGQQCHPGNGRPVSQALQFPGGASVQVSDVYRSLCPCEGAATCSSSGTCMR